MAQTRFLIHCLAILIIAVWPSEGASSCYYCRNGRSNEECNAGPIQNCGQWTYRSVLNEVSGYACEVEVYTIRGRKIIKKKCIDGSQCYNPNMRQCDSNGRRCAYCCFGNRCNELEIPVWSSTTTTNPTTILPVTSYHTYPTTQHSTGSPGPVGQPGSQGPVGQKGVRGTSGMPGIKGNVGDKGDQGDQGQQGSPGHGFPGLKGDHGQPGLLGPKGIPGEIDPDKLKGEKGDIGMLGYHGYDGFQGEPSECECPEPAKEPMVSFSVMASNVEQTSDYYEHVPIEIVISNNTNVGTSISSEYMDFTAPVDGIYVFHMTSVANGNGATPLVLFQDSTEVIVTTGRSDEHATGVYPIGNAHTTLEMNKGQLVSVVIRQKRQGFFWGLVDIYSPSDVTFSGFLLAHLPVKMRAPTF